MDHLRLGRHHLEVQLSITQPLVQLMAWPVECACSARLRWLCPHSVLPCGILEGAVLSSYWTSNVCLQLEAIFARILTKTTHAFRGEGPGLWGVKVVVIKC